MPPRRILVPVHEINEHLGVLLVFLHLHGVSKNHVQIEHKILDLQLVTKGSAVVEAPEK